MRPMFSSAVLRDLASQDALDFQSVEHGDGRLTGAPPSVWPDAANAVSTCHHQDSCELLDHGVPRANLSRMINSARGSGLPQRMATSKWLKGAWPRRRQRTQHRQKASVFAVPCSSRSASGTMGLARSFRGEPARPWRGLRDLRRLLAQPLPRDQGPEQDHALSGEDDREDQELCSRCGTPLIYERPHAPQMVNIPRALIGGRTGREPRYHIAIAELQDGPTSASRFVPLKGYPGVVGAAQPQEAASGHPRTNARISCARRSR